jgi:tetratricopeptide (TPR) repeat protein
MKPSREEARIPAWLLEPVEGAPVELARSPEPRRALSLSKGAPSVSSEELVAHAALLLESWDGAPPKLTKSTVSDVSDARDLDDFRDTQEFDVAPTRASRRPLAAWLLVAVGAAGALTAGSFWLQPAEPQPMECRLPVPVADSVIESVSAPLFITDDAPAVKLRHAPPVSDQRVAQLLEAANAQANKGKYRAALGLYEKARKLAPRNADVFYGVALSRYELGHRQLAAIAAARAITHNPAHPGATLLLGFISQEAGAWASSRRLYEEYLAVSPEGETAQELKSVLAQLPKR